MNEEIIKDRQYGGIITVAREDLIPDGKSPDQNNLLPVRNFFLRKRPGMSQCDDTIRNTGTDFSNMYLDSISGLADGKMVFVTDDTNGVYEIYQYIPRYTT